VFEIETLHNISDGWMSAMFSFVQLVPNHKLLEHPSLCTVVKLEMF